MAYLVRRAGGKVQIRECVRTEQGPRSRMLASFRGALNDHALDQAAHKASLDAISSPVNGRRDALDARMRSTE